MNYIPHAIEYNLVILGNEVPLHKTISKSSLHMFLMKLSSSFRGTWVPLYPGRTILPHPDEHRADSEAKITKYLKYPNLTPDPLPP